MKTAFKKAICRALVASKEPLLLSLPFGSLQTVGQRRGFYLGKRRMFIFLPPKKGLCFEIRSEDGTAPIKILFPCRGIFTRLKTEDGYTFAWHPDILVPHPDAGRRVKGEKSAIPAKKTNRRTGPDMKGAGLKSRNPQNITG